MKFDEATVAEFTALYEEIFGERLTVAEATDILHKMVSLYCVLLRPLPKDEA